MGFVGTYIDGGFLWDQCIRKSIYILVPWMHHGRTGAGLFTHFMCNHTIVPELAGDFKFKQILFNLDFFTSQVDQGFPFEIWSIF